MPSLGARANQQTAPLHCMKLSPVHQFARERLAHLPLTRGVLLSEPAEMPQAEFLSKIPTWLSVLRAELGDLNPPSSCYSNSFRPGQKRGQ